MKSDAEMQGLREEYNRILQYQSADDSAQQHQGDSSQHSDVRRSGPDSKVRSSTGNMKGGERHASGKVSVSQDTGEFMKYSNKSHSLLTKSSPVS